MAWEALADEIAEEMGYWTSGRHAEQVEAVLARRWTTSESSPLCLNCGGAMPPERRRFCARRCVVRFHQRRYAQREEVRARQTRARRRWRNSPAHKAKVAERRESDPAFRERERERWREQNRRQRERRKAEQTRIKAANEAAPMRRAA